MLYYLNMYSMYLDNVLYFIYELGTFYMYIKNFHRDIKVHPYMNTQGRCSMFSEILYTVEC